LINNYAGYVFFCTLIDYLVASWYRLADVILLRPFEPGASFKPKPKPRDVLSSIFRNWSAALKRREFITLIGGTVSAWPILARAQRHGGIARIGVLLPATANDTEYPTLLNAFLQGLQQLGWADGRNLQIDIRWSGGNADEINKNAVELAALVPAVIVASGSSTVGPLLQATRTVPIVFVVVPDPVGAGFVDSLARPGGSATGFASFEYGIGGKWLEILKEIAPSVTRVAVFRDSTITAGMGQWGAIQTSAPKFAMEVSPINLREASEIERSVTAFAHKGNGGLIVTSSSLSVRHRDLLVMLAAQHKLPAIYYSRAFVALGGLISYGPDRIDQFRRAAGYVDRILRGDKPADLPVQEPTKYELAVNLKTAKTQGLDVPAGLLGRADEVIE
jgi:putative tryptophan/tyrosine transport system substrate-binding protein